MIRKLSNDADNLPNMCEKVHGWVEKLLSATGKEVLIKSVAREILV